LDFKKRAKGAVVVVVGSSMRHPLDYPRTPSSDQS